MTRRKAIYINTDGEISEAHMYPDSRPVDCYEFIGFCHKFVGGEKAVKEEAASKLEQARFELGIKGK